MPSKPTTLLRNALWVASLYLAMGIPYNVINGTAVRMFKSLGYADSQITVAVGSIGIAWSLKPLWAAFLDMYRTKKFFVLTMEMLCGLLFAAIDAVGIAAGVAGHVGRAGVGAFEVGGCVHGVLSGLPLGCGMGFSVSAFIEILRCRKNIFTRLTASR